MNRRTMLGALLALPIVKVVKPKVKRAITGEGGKEAVIPVEPNQVVLNSPGCLIGSDISKYIDEQYLLALKDQA